MTPSPRYSEVFASIFKSHWLSALFIAFTLMIIGLAAYTQLVVQPACERVYGGPRLMVEARIFPKPTCLWTSEWIPKPVPKEKP